MNGKVQPPQEENLQQQNSVKITKQMSELEKTTISFQQNPSEKQKKNKIIKKQRNNGYYIIIIQEGNTKEKKSWLRQVE
jgi:hypothetical protein